MKNKIDVFQYCVGLKLPVTDKAIVREIQSVDSAVRFIRYMFPIEINGIRGLQLFY